MIGESLPHGGAWIETPFLPERSQPAKSLPHGGAWIETSEYFKKGAVFERRSLTGERGLKHTRRR